MNGRSVHSTRKAAMRFAAAIAACGALLPLGPAWGARVDRYVAQDGQTPDLLGQYTSWGNAASNIQAAISAAVAGNGDQVVVRAGLYDTGGTEILGLTNRVHVNKAIVVRSEHNDPENTIIKGAWDPVSTNGPAAVRGVYLVAGASLIGFTVTNGATLAQEGSTSESRVCGGGVFAAASSAVISNCVIVGNAGHGFHWGHLSGGGAFGGTYYDCKILGNRVGGDAVNGGYGRGGGVGSATLFRTLIAGNMAVSGREQHGGGGYRVTLYDCVVSNNVAAARGGGLMESTAYDSDIIYNRAGIGGGAFRCVLLSNCYIAHNHVTGGSPFSYGAGVGCDARDNFGKTIPATVLVDSRIMHNIGANGALYGTVATNCVIASNATGGAYRQRRLANCLIYGNVGGVSMDAVWYVTEVESSTIVGNTGTGLSASSTGRVLSYNTIVFDNGTGGNNNWSQSGDGWLAFTNTVTTPAQVGWDVSNLAADPQFVAMGSGYGLSHVKGDYRLRATSPALNAGGFRDWMVDALDLDGNPRIDRVTGLVDIGAYEYVYRATILLVR